MVVKRKMYAIIKEAGKEGKIVDILDIYLIDCNTIKIVFKENKNEEVNKIYGGAAKCET